MNTRPSIRQRVAILDPAYRSREHARRAVRAMGHSPHVFASIEEMREVDVASRPYAMVYVGCALDAEGIAHTVDSVRHCVGPTVPMLLAVKPQSVRRVARTTAACQVISLQPGFSNLYLALADFMWMHGPAPHHATLNWGAFRFLPSSNSVQVGAAAPTTLSAFHFELALELFHNLGRNVSAGWLNAMLAPPSRVLSAATLENGFARLEQLMALQRPVVWQVRWLGSGAFRLDTVPPDAVPIPMEFREFELGAPSLRALPSLFFSAGGGKKWGLHRSMKRMN